MEDIRKILLCCSSRGDRISLSEFHLIMTREDKNDFSGTPACAINPGTKSSQQAAKAASNMTVVDSEDVVAEHMASVEDGQMLNLPHEVNEDSALSRELL